MKKGALLTAIAVLLLLPLPTSFAAKKALLVGVADYASLPSSCRLGMSDLRGPVNDVDMMKNIFTSRYGFAENEISVLLNSQATYKNIKAAFESWLVRGTQPGDIAIFYFSGHGSRVPDLNGDEEDGFDEVLCPYDMVPRGGANIILDDEMGLWLAKLEGRTVIVILDSCHSGGATRSIGKKPVSVLEETGATRSRFLPITDYQPSPIALSRSRGADIPGSVILLAAAREFEPALELRLPQGFYGGFTFGLGEAMGGGAKPSYQKLFDQARKVVKDRLRLVQEPQLMAERKLAALSAFKEIEPVAPSRPEPVKPPQPPKPPAAAVSAISQSSAEPNRPPEFSAGPETNRPTAPPEVVGERVLVALDVLNGWGDEEIKSLKEGLRRLPILQLVDSKAFFDRLVRGEKLNGTYHVRVINSVGDAYLIPPSASVGEVVKRLGDHLEYAFTAKQFAKIRHPDPPFKVNVWLTDRSRRDFQVGEKIVFGVIADKDSHILLINLDSTGDYHVIFPNRYHRESFAKSNTELLIPDLQMQSSEFELVFGTPVGEETIKVIATSEPLIAHKLGLGASNDSFRTFSGNAKADFIHGLAQALSSPGLEWSEDTIVIRSHDVRKE
jgi:hypothetical protein